MRYNVEFKTKNTMWRAAGWYRLPSNECLRRVEGWVNGNQPAMERYKYEFRCVEV